MQEPRDYLSAQSAYAPPPSAKSPRKRRRGCFIGLGVAATLLVILVVAAIATPNASTQTSPPLTTPTTQQAAQYPPKTENDLHGLARLGDASAIHEFQSESESVGLTGVCAQPKRLVTVDPSITGKQLAEDLLAYFYGNQLDSPCGSVVFAFHTQAEGNGDNGYTAGRINFDATDSSGAENADPNAANLKYTLTLDVGGILTSQQEYVVNY